MAGRADRRLPAGRTGRRPVAGRPADRFGGVRRRGDAERRQPELLPGYRGRKALGSRPRERADQGPLGAQADRRHLDRGRGPGRRRPGPGDGHGETAPRVARVRRSEESQAKRHWRHDGPGADLGLRGLAAGPGRTGAPRRGDQETLRGARLPVRGYSRRDPGRGSGREAGADHRRRGRASQDRPGRLRGQRGVLGRPPSPPDGEDEEVEPPDPDPQARRVQLGDGPGGPRQGQGPVPPVRLQGRRGRRARTRRDRAEAERRAHRGPQTPARPGDSDRGGAALEAGRGPGRGGRGSARGSAGRDVQGPRRAAGCART